MDGAGFPRKAGQARALATGVWESTAGADEGDGELDAPAVSRQPLRPDTSSAAEERKPQTGALFNLAALFGGRERPSSDNKNEAYQTMRQAYETLDIEREARRYKDSEHESAPTRSEAVSSDSGTAMARETHSIGAVQEPDLAVSNMSRKHTGSVGPEADSLSHGREPGLAVPSSLQEAADTVAPMDLNPSGDLTPVAPAADCKALQEDGLFQAQNAPLTEAVAQHLAMNGLESAQAYEAAGALLSALEPVLEAQPEAVVGIRIETDGELVATLYEGTPADSAPEEVLLPVAALVEIHEHGMPTEGVQALREGVGDCAEQLSDLQIVAAFGTQALQDMGETGFPSEQVDFLESALREELAGGIQFDRLDVLSAYLDAQWSAGAEPAVILEDSRGMSASRQEFEGGAFERQGDFANAEESESKTAEMAAEA